MIGTPSRHFASDPGSVLVPLPEKNYNDKIFAFPLFGGRAIAHCTASEARPCVRTRVGSTNWQEMAPSVLGHMWSWGSHMNFGNSTLYMGCGSGPSKYSGRTVRSLVIIH